MMIFASDSKIGSILFDRKVLEQNGDISSGILVGSGVSVQEAFFVLLQKNVKSIQENLNLKVATKNGKRA